MNTESCFRLAACQSREQPTRSQQIFHGDENRVLLQVPMQMFLSHFVSESTQYNVCQVRDRYKTCVLCFTSP